jgi:hypothetical protein
MVLIMPNVPTSVGCRAAYQSTIGAVTQHHLDGPLRRRWSKSQEKRTQADRQLGRPGPAPCARRRCSAPSAGWNLYGSRVNPAPGGGESPAGATGVDLLRQEPGKQVSRMTASRGSANGQHKPCHPKQRSYGPALAAGSALPTGSPM